MPRDKGLEELIRAELQGLALSEKAMFGGRAWLLHGHLTVGARSDGMLARLGKGRAAWALGLADVTPMITRGRVMDGWVRAGAAAYGDDALRGRLVAAAVAFVSALPPKV
jgi:hypothetical protein